MHYITILGRQPEFGLLELESLLGSSSVSPFGKQAAIIDQELDINRLGGTQKIGRVLYHGPERDLNETPIALDDLPSSTGKTSFGLSYYGPGASQRYVVKIGMTLKKRLKSTGSMRFVAPQTGTHLSAAQVKFNALTSKGFELLVIVHRGQMIVAITEQIQDIDGYASRDYQRPSRSAKVGMLPPKLAQIMINTTSAPLVYDPFAGTGVIPQEALLLGRSAAGSDISPEMVEASTENDAWLRSKRPDLPPAPVILADARTVELPDEPLAIVSEGYLGANMSSRPALADITELQSNLCALYSESLRSWHNQLDDDGEVTITAPMWHTTTGWHGLDLIDQLPDLGYTLRSFALVDSRTIIYRRPDQVVGRQLLLLRKN